MSFVNVFSKGPQTVHVDVGDKEAGSWSWSGSIAAGGQASFTDPLTPTNTITIKVSSSGTVDVYFSEAVSGEAIDVYVSVPSDTGSVQIADCQTNSTSNPYAQYASGKNTNVNYAQLTYVAGGYATPNPYAFTTPSPLYVFGLYAITPTNSTWDFSSPVSTFQVMYEPASSGWSIFAYGPCVVSVGGAQGGAPFWSGVLGLGESSPVVTGPTGSQIQVVVDAEGFITYSYTTNTGTPSQEVIDVVPQFDTSGYSIGLDIVSSDYYGSGTFYYSASGSMPLISNPSGLYTSSITGPVGATQGSLLCYAPTTTQAVGAVSLFSFKPVITNLAPPSNLPAQHFSDVALTWSDDGGHTWSNRLVQRILVGQTGRRVMFRRIGSTRRGHGLDRILELSGEPLGRVALSGAMFVVDPLEEARQ